MAVATFPLLDKQLQQASVHGQITDFNLGFRNMQWVILGLTPFYAVLSMMMLTTEYSDKKNLSYTMV